MKGLFKYIFLLTATTTLFSCATSKGSSSLGQSIHSNTTSSVPKAPRIKSESELQSLKETSEQKRAENEQYISSRIEDAKQTAQTTKQQIQTSVDETVSTLKEESIVVRTEAVKIVETKQTAPAGKFHIIIGSFKVLVNARAASDNAVKDGFLPSIMENDEGMYRVAVFSGDEDTARKKIHEMRQDSNKYVGIWLLAEK